MNDIRRELEARNLSVRGLKSQLILRLTRALRSETEREAADESSSPEQDEPDDENLDEDKKKKKEEEKKMRDEKEKAIDRRTFPESPAIVVRPSRTAKHGKFDCAIMSLSLLLDYRQEDNKEHSFEVSLFAELFNEMMMRDFGFRIYRALVEAPEAKEDDKDKRKSEKKDEKRDRKDEKEDSHRKEDRNDVDSDKEDDESEEDDCDGDEKRDKDRKRRRKKRSQTRTGDPNLLLSFVYYDQTHCGYLLDKDLEEIFHTLGLMLTRAQVRKLIQKVSRREVLRYRRLTDGPADSEKPIKSDDAKIDLESLALGNKKHIPEFARAPGSSEGEPPVVSCRGGLVDVGKLVDKLEHSERARLEADEKIQSCLLELERLHEDAAAREKLQQKLSVELEDQKQKLRLAEEELRRARQESDKCHRALGGVREGLQATLAVVDGTLTKKSGSRSSRNSPSRRKDSEAPRAIKQEAKKSGCEEAVAVAATEAEPARAAQADDGKFSSREKLGNDTPSEPREETERPTVVKSEVIDMDTE